jgi:indole-3-glycerol phosphate synthase
MSRLTEIIATRRERIAAAKNAVPRESLAGLAAEKRKDASAHRLLRSLSEGDGVKIIAEFKRRSPSKGIINEHANLSLIVSQYQRGGAAAISVLSEPDYFNGSLDDLREARATTALPILRKDFIVDEYQVFESAAAGADALLLIVAALDDSALRSLRQLTEDDLGMDALVEVHTAEEMQRAIDCGANIIGVNNRNLATFEVSLDTSIELAAEAGSEKLLVSESGIETIEDIKRLLGAGYRGFLIGETLMRSDDPEALLRKFTQIHDAVTTS